jgi:hypothetical protein
MNDLVFRTGGDWDSTTLFNGGVEVPAAQLFVEIKAGRDEFGDPISGGIFEGADLTAIIRPQENPDSPFDILPGRISMDFPGYNLVVENSHPGVYLDQTRVALNGEDITARVVDLYVDVNAVDDVVSAWITVYKPHWIRRDELITYTIVG